MKPLRRAFGKRLNGTWDINNIMTRINVTKPQMPDRTRFHADVDQFFDSGWKADENFDSGIVKTVKWYLEKYNGV